MHAEETRVGPEVDEKRIRTTFEQTRTGTRLVMFQVPNLRLSPYCD
jgi:hypothetical protein